MLTSAAVSQVRRAVRSALLLEAGEPGLWTWTAVVPEEDFVAAVARHRVAGLLAAAAGDLGLSPTLAAALTTMAERSRLDALAALRQLHDVERVLDGLDHLVLKGPPLAVRTTGDPFGRGPGDVDVLVPPARVGEALDRLLDAGWECRDGLTVDRESWAWRHQLETTYELVLDGPLGSVDLHWRLDPTHDGLPGFEELWPRREQVAAGQVEVHTLSPADTFAHVLRHAAKDGWNSLRSLVDVHRLAARSDVWPPGGLDRLARATLTVTRATVGLPAGVPAFEEERLGLPSALAGQARELHQNRFPGDHLGRYLTYCLRSSRTPRDLVLAARIAVLPPVVTAGLHDRNAAAAVAHGLTARAVGVGRRLARPWRG